MSSLGHTVHDPNARWIVAVTGASGIRYALRLIDVLSLHCASVHVVFSEAALRVLQEEERVKVSFSKLSSERLLGESRSNVTFYNINDIGATIASGSAIFNGMVVVPCSMGTLASIAHGICGNLIHRAADVTIKERRRLILVPRETPLSSIHLENMLKLSNLGVAIVPAMPGFYHQPSTIEDIVDMMVMKILDQMGMRVNLVERWGESPNDKPQTERPAILPFSRG